MLRLNYFLFCISTSYYSHHYLFIYESFIFYLFYHIIYSEAKDEIIQLNLEMFTRDIVKDTTPGAMLFFSALHDRNIVPNLQQLMLQMGHLKGKFMIHFRSLSS